MARSAVCVLASGGVDSCVLTWKLLHEGADVQPLYVRAGMVWEAVEHRWLERFLEAIASPGLRPLRALDFPLKDVYEAHWSVSAEGTPGYGSPDEAMYLPGRNVVLLSKAALYCALSGIHRIASGVLGGNPFPDATDAFFQDMARALSEGLAHEIRIERPFAGMQKAEVVRLGSGLPLELTFSCVRPVGELHCGDCNKCAERQQAFAAAQLADPTRYAVSRNELPS